MGDYEAFEATVIADYDAQSAVERELVLRLASVLWRLRRATGIIKQSSQSEALIRASADPSLSRLFLDPQDQSSQGVIQIVAEKVPIADIRAVDRHANLSNEPPQSL